MSDIKRQDMSAVMNNALNLFTLRRTIRCSSGRSYVSSIAAMCSGIYILMRFYTQHRNEAEGD